jgi:hypothetical protein
LPSGFGKPHPHHGHPTLTLLLLQVEPIGKHRGGAQRGGLSARRAVASFAARKLSPRRRISPPTNRNDTVRGRCVVGGEPLEQRGHTSEQESSEQDSRRPLQGRMHSSRAERFRRSNPHPVLVPFDFRRRPDLEFGLSESNGPTFAGCPHALSSAGHRASIRPPTTLN